MNLAVKAYTETPTRMRRGSREVGSVQIMVRSGPWESRGVEPQTAGILSTSWPAQRGDLQGRPWCVRWGYGRNVPSPLSSLLHPESSLMEEAPGMSKVPTCQLTAFSSSL